MCVSDGCTASDSVHLSMANLPTGGESAHAAGYLAICPNDNIGHGAAWFPARMFYAEVNVIVTLTLEDLLMYTSWERQKWYQFFSERGEQILKTGVGPHGDGRFNTIGDLVRHIFGAEKRYIERLSDEELTDLTKIPSDQLESLFQFGEKSRKALREFMESFPDAKWFVPQDFHFPNLSLSARATPFKIVIHILMHEVRHWAQIATLLRLSGVVSEFHDFLVCPLM